MVLRFLVLVSIVVVLGCAHHETYEERQQRDKQREEILQQAERVDQQRVADQQRKVQEHIEAQQEAQQRAAQQEAQQRKVQEHIEAQQRAAQQEAQQRAARLEVEQKLARIQNPIQKSTLPKNYRVQIDASFVRTLKDPDSRKIVYLSNPYGSLVCGTINARNSYGGYTGPQPFYAYFTPHGQLVELQSDFRVFQFLMQQARDLALAKLHSDSFASIRPSTELITGGVSTKAEALERIRNLQRVESETMQQFGGSTYKLLHDCGFQIP